ASHEILGPLFEHYLADLFCIEVTYQLPMETTEDLDIMQIEESNDMQIIENALNGNQIIENALNGNQPISQNDQIWSAKRKLETKEIKEIKELWKQKLEGMHYNSIYDESGLTSPFRNCLRIFVEEKLPYAEEKLKKINNSLSKRRKY
ncbi:16142_t:CDS:1, partial [Dentiscutata erythropus]